MRRVLLLLLVAVASVASSSGQTPSGADRKRVEEIRREVLQVEDEMTRAILRSDVAVLDRIYADDFFYMNGDGEILDKARVLADYRSGNNTLRKLEHDDIHVRVFGDIAVLTGRSNSTVQYKNNVAAIPRRFTNIFVKLDGRWQIVSHQVTDVKQR